MVVASQIAMLDALSGEAEEGWRQAAAADAAVAAVAKVCGAHARGLPLGSYSNREDVLLLRCSLVCS